MREKLKFYGAILILIVLVPYLMTIYFHGMPGKFSGGREDAGIEQKVIQMVAAEMSGHYETEALKAQAVIARTNLSRDPDLAIEENQENQEENLETITFCVEETAGEILTWKGEAIDAAYHAVSSGNTRNAAEVSGQEGKDYLQSVESRQDISSMEYLNIIYMEKQEMAQKLQGLLGAAATVDAEGLPDSLTIEARDSAGYVTRVRCGSVVGCAWIIFLLLLFLTVRWKNQDNLQGRRSWTGTQPVWRQRTCKRRKKLSGNLEILLSRRKDLKMKSLKIKIFNW